MNILALSDIESEYLWNERCFVKLKNVDLILSCGDLRPEYLSFIATYTHAPVLYVHGNHDDCYEHKPPDGCICIEDKIFCYKGLRILGLGGSVRYKNGTHQYSQAEMKRRVRKMWLPLLWHGGFDILLTHAPAFGLGDAEDLPHQGFHVFNKLLNRYKPTIMLHGHTHLNYGVRIPRKMQYEQTEIINAYERHFFTIPDKTESVQESSTRNQYERWKRIIGNRS